MKLSQRHFTELCIFLFVLFLAIFDYPFIARLVNERNTDGVVLETKTLQEKTSLDDVHQIIQMAKDYNQSLANGLGGFNTTFGKEGMNEKYRSLLAFDSSGVMGIIEIPTINVNLPIYHGTSETVLQKGAGHVEGSSLPIGGESTHSCISGHRGLPSKKLFTRLDELKIDDIFLIHVFNEIHAYQVINIEVVEPTQIEPLKIQRDKDLVTLITCTPYGINSHRLYVTGTRIPYNPEVIQEATKPTLSSYFKEWWWVLINILMVLIMGIMLIQLNRKERCKKR